MRFENKDRITGFDTLTDTNIIMMRPRSPVLNLMIRKLISPKFPKLSRLPSPSPLCTIADSSSFTPGLPTAPPEPPDLPSWFHSNNPDRQTPWPYDENDDDFVVPSLAEWASTSNNLKADRKLAPPMLFEQKVSDIDRVTEILKKGHPSVDAVVQELDGCGIDPTDALVSQALKRFSYQWVLASGVFTWAKGRTNYVHTPELYDLMVDVLGKCRKFSLMWDLIEEMKGLEGFVSLVTMSKVIRRLAKVNKDEAVEAFKGIENFGVSRDVNSLIALMDALVKEGSVELAHSVAMEFKDRIPLDGKGFNVLIHGYCKARKLDDAMKIMNEMEKQGFQPDVASYTCFVEAYCKEKDFKSVDATLNEMKEKGCKPNVITYTVIMHSYGKAGQIKEALEVYERMKIDGCVPDTAFYDSLIFIMSKFGRIKDALDVFEDMERQGVPRDSRTYNTLISSACSHSLEELALKLLRRMEDDSCQADVQTYAPLLKLFCRKNSLRVLKFLLSHMVHKNVGMDFSTYALLVRGFCKSGKIEHACAFFEEMVLKGMIPMHSTYTTLVEEVKLKDMAATRKIEELMLRAQKQKAI